MLKKAFKIMLLCLLMLIAVGCSDSTDTQEDAAETADNHIVVGFSQLGAESDWRTANTESMKEVFSEENGYELVFDDAQQKQENQITAIRKFIQQEVDYIVLAPVTETGWDTVLQEAKDAGIPVIIVDRMVAVSDDSLYAAWVGSNFALEGEKAAEWINQFLQKKNIEHANIVNIQGTIGATAQIGRTESLEKACKRNSNMTLLAEASGEFTQAKGQEVMESFLKEYEDINIVYCENDNSAFGAIDALEAAGKKVGSNIEKGEVMVLSFDAARAGIQDVLDGKITLATECNPLHGPRVQAVIKTMESGGVPNKIAYAEEGMFAHDNTVKSVIIEEIPYDVTVVTQDILDGRVY